MALALLHVLKLFMILLKPLPMAFALFTWFKMP